MPVAPGWDIQSLQNLDVQPQLVPRSWLEMGAKTPGPGRYFPVTASRVSCPQGKANPFVDISPFQDLLNIFSVSLQLLQGNNPRENP